MKKDEIELKTLFRNPVYPVIIISNKQLFAGQNIRNLALALLHAHPPNENDYIKVIDSTGEEFWYMPDLEALAPGFLSKKWTKKQIIELFNESINSILIDESYSSKPKFPRKLA
jgi:hypothetical protein